MHFVFIPYGKKSAVDLLISEMSAQKHLLQCKKGKKKIAYWVQGAIRVLPFGIYEYVFPKEDLDKVLATLTADKTPYRLNRVIMKFLRTTLKLKEIPKFKKKEKYLWIREFVSIIPLGIREDDDYIEETGENKGYAHEGL